MVQRAAERAAQLVRRLLAFGRKQILASECVNLTTLLGAQLPALNKAAGPDIDLRLRVPDREVWCDLDVQQFEDVIMEVIDNARQAQGTRKVEIALAVAPVEHALDSALQQTDCAQIVISDDGEGIAPENQHRVFEPFFSTRDVGQGSGLGLSFVHGFISQSGGDVTVKSQVNAGTTVTLAIPLADKPVD